MSAWEEDTITVHHRLEVTGGEDTVQVLLVAIEAIVGVFPTSILVRNLHHNSR
jgi:hypothetical protein